MTPYDVYSICFKENKRKPELEPIILTDPYYSFCYALYVIKGRWPEAEKVIRKDEILWYWYCKYFNIKPKK